MKVTKLAAIVLAATVGAANAAVVNGGFDAPSSLTGHTGQTVTELAGQSGLGSWEVFQAIPGWQTGSGAGIELQTTKTLSQIDPHSGDYYVEMDSHNNSSMYQNLWLDAGTYDLSFYYSPRTHDSGSNGIGFSIGDLIDQVNGPSNLYFVGDWAQVTRTFTVAEGTHALSFWANTRNDSYGGLIDSVSVSAVPVPASALLLLGGLAGFGALRRKKA